VPANDPGITEPAPLYGAGVVAPRPPEDPGLPIESEAAPTAVPGAPVCAPAGCTITSQTRVARRPESVEKCVVLFCAMSTLPSPLRIVREQLFDSELIVFFTFIGTEMSTYICEEGFSGQIDSRQFGLPQFAVVER
jgi:hypothetical protein